MVGKFPFLFMAESHPRVPVAARRACARIKSRTQAESFYDANRDALCFGYMDKSDPPRLLDILIQVRRPGGSDMTFDPALDRLSEDDVVTLIQLAKVDPKRKRLWEKQRETMRRSDNAKWAQDKITDSIKEAEKSARFKLGRAGMGRHSRGSAVVSGLKS